MQLAISYLILCLGAEFMTAKGLFIPAAMLHGFIILTAFGWFGVRYTPSRPRLPFGFGLVSLLRFINLTLPLALLPPVARYAVVALPLWIAMWLMTRQLSLSSKSLGLRLHDIPWQIWIAFSGLPLGLAGYWILKPQPLMPDARVWELVAGVMVLFTSAALAEEFLFRGVLLSLARQELGYAGVVIINLIFAGLYLGTGSVFFALFMGLVGWGFSECANRTQSIWGVVLAHTLLILGMGLFWPLVFPLS